MKTKITFSLILLFTLSATLFTQAQSNHYFNNSPVWQISSTCSIGGPCYRIESYNYYTSGDTLIDSIRYVQFYKVGQGHYDWQAPFQNPGCSGNFVDRDSVPRYFLRSDAKQIFVRFPGDSLEQLLYDFNLNVGDTLPITYNNLFHDIVVSGIDSVLTPNGYYKRFALSGPTWSNYLIEGIGHSRGLIQPLRAPLECAFMLTCFGMQDTAYYPNQGPTCTIAIGIQEINQELKVAIYPNPSQAGCTFSFDASVKNIELKLHSIYGQTLHQIYASPNGKIVFERNNLSSGIYFYEIMQGNHSLASGKLMLE